MNQTVVHLNRLPLAHMQQVHPESSTECQNTLRRRELQHLFPRCCLEANHLDNLVKVLGCLFLYLVHYLRHDLFLFPQYDLFQFPSLFYFLYHLHPLYVIHLQLLKLCKFLKNFNLTSYTFCSISQTILSESKFCKISDTVKFIYF